MANAWLDQQLDKMVTGISAGKTMRRKVQSVKKENVTEEMIADAVKARGWKVAQIGDDYVFAPGNYTIRPIV
jgi:hypothetical protein